MILRVSRHERDFTIVDNATLRDPDLSFRATGMLVYLLSQPDGWDVNGRVLAGAKREGRDAVYSALQELEDVGYLVRTNERQGDGTFVHVSTVYETRQPRPTPAYSSENGSSSAQVGLNGSEGELTSVDHVLEIRQPDPGFQERENPDQENQDRKKGLNNKDYQEDPTALGTQSDSQDAPPKKALAKRQLPKDFEVTPAMRGWAATHTPAVNVDAELEQFTDYHRANASTKADWVATWRTWMRNAKKWGGGTGWKAVDKTHRNPDNVLHDREGGSRVVQRPASWD